ncbi:protein of unknown function [Cupriavidus taiwanensis]|nr:protein of unknown function [Cupriavidus taiwanensis]
MSQELRFSLHVFILRPIGEKGRVILKGVRGKKMRWMRSNPNFAISSNATIAPNFDVWIDNAFNI